MISLVNWLVDSASELAASAMTGVMESLQFLLFQSFFMDEPYNGRWMWGCNATVVAVVIALTTAMVILWCLPPPKDNNPVENYSYPSPHGALAFSPDQKSIVFRAEFQSWNSRLCG